MGDAWRTAERFPFLVGASVYWLCYLVVDLNAVDLLGVALDLLVLGFLAWVHGLLVCRVT